MSKFDEILNSWNRADDFLAKEIENKPFEAENLLPYPYFTGSGGTYQGVSSVVNDDGSVTLNTSASGATGTNVVYAFMWNSDDDDIKLENKKYVFNTNAPFVSAKVRADMRLVRKNGTELIINGDKSTITEIDNTNGEFDRITHVSIYVTFGTVLTNFIVKPMLEVGDVPHEYQSPKYSKKSLEKRIATLEAALLEVASLMEE